MGGPFFIYRRDQRGSEVGFRPFFYWRSAEDKYSQLEYLYPLGKYKKTPQEVESYLMPFYLTRQDLTRGEKRERNFFLAFWGETESGEPYGGFFPLGGSLKNRFGKEEMNFVLWPLYSDSREGENKTYTFLWPIFTRTSGGGREGFKIWPIMGYENKEQEYVKSFFLWPFFHFEKRYLYTNDPVEISMFFPFYIEQASSRRATYTILWPFFNYTYDEDENYRQIDFPWPFLQWAKGDDKSILRIFPLYGHKHWEERESGYILWPLYWYDRQEEADYRMWRHRYLLFSKNQMEIWSKEGKKAQTLRLWPFFYYGLRKEGAVHFYFPALLPIDDEGFERNWGPLLRLYEYYRSPQGDWESRFLWGIYLHRQSAQRELYELSFLFTLYRAENLFYFSILRGLVEYRATGRERALRLFYSPWPVEWEVDRKEDP